MTTIVFHPGSPKTATSTLQHVLGQNRAALARRGIGVILPPDIRGNVYLAKYLAAYRGKAIPDIREASAAFFRPWRKYDLVICSEETFCHDFMPSRRYGQGGIDRAAVAAELLAMSGFERTEVVLTIRPQAAFLASTFSHFVHRHGEARRFVDWLKEEVDLERVMWKPVVEAFRGQFGADAVRVVSMDRSVAPGGAEAGDGIENYLGAVLDAMGLPRRSLSLNVDKVHNPSPSIRALALCRMVNQRTPEADLAERVNSFVISTFPTESFGKFKPRMGLPPGMGRRFVADHAAALAPV